MPHTPRRLVLAIGLVTAAAAPAGAQQLKSTVWWNEAEPGWGLYIADQGDVLVPYWFTHDVDGEPVWFLAPTFPQADGSYRGSFERITGVPFAQIQGQAADAGVPLGEAHLEFAEDNTLSFTYTVDGQTQNKQLKRFAFGDKDVFCRTSGAPREAAENYSDIWWNPMSSGWGVHISHVDNDLYFTWYTYDADGEPIFYQGVTSYRLDQSYAGPLYRSNDGTPFLQINGAPVTDGAEIVGSARLIFADGAHATFEYNIGNISQSRQIQRYQFGSSGSVCKVAEYGSDPGDDDGDNGSGTGDPMECFPPYSLGDRRELRFDVGKPTESTRIETTTIPTQFEGQQALMEEVSGDAGAGIVVYARNYLQAGVDSNFTLGSEAISPSTGEVISRSVNDPIHIERPRAFRIGQRQERAWTELTTAQGNTTSKSFRDQVTLEAVEAITVEAGTFAACRFATRFETEAVADGGGFDIITRVRRTGFMWTSPVFGLLRSIESGTAEAVSPVFVESREVTESLELVSASAGGVDTR